MKGRKPIVRKNSPMNSFSLNPTSPVAGDGPRRALWSVPASGMRNRKTIVVLCELFERDAAPLATRQTRKPLGQSRYTRTRGSKMTKTKAKTKAKTKTRGHDKSNRNIFRATADKV